MSIIIIGPIVPIRAIILCLNIPGFLGGMSVKNLPANTGDAKDVGSIPGLEKSPGGGNSNPLQYSCLENPQWTEETGSCSSWFQKESDTTEHTLPL